MRGASARAKQVIYMCARGKIHYARKSATAEPANFPVDYGLLCLPPNEPTETSRPGQKAIISIMQSKTEKDGVKTAAAASAPLRRISNASLSCVAA